MRFRDGPGHRPNADSQGRSPRAQPGGYARNWGAVSRRNLRAGSSPTPATDRLDSWKEIAAYLKREARTCSGGAHEGCSSIVTWTRNWGRSTPSNQSSTFGGRTATTGSIDWTQRRARRPTGSFPPRVSPSRSTRSIDRKRDNALRRCEQRHDESTQRPGCADSCWIARDRVGSDLDDCLSHWRSRIYARANSDAFVRDDYVSSRLHPAGRLRPRGPHGGLQRRMGWRAAATCFVTRLDDIGSRSLGLQAGSRSLRSHPGARSRSSEGCRFRPWRARLRGNPGSRATGWRRASTRREACASGRLVTRWQPTGRSDRRIRRRELSRLELPHRPRALYLAAERVDRLPSCVRPPGNHVAFFDHPHGYGDNGYGGDRRAPAGAQEENAVQMVMP